VARTLIEVHGGDTPVQLVLKPPPTLTGKVTFQNPADRPRHALYVNFVEEDGGKPVTAAVNPDGSFWLPTVTAANVRVYLSGSDGLFLARMSVEGAAMKNGVIDVVEGASVRVDLLASGETGGLKGFATNDEKPAPAVLVVIAPAADAFDPDRCFAAQSGTDGSFDFSNLPSGDYVLFAVNNPEFAYAESDAVLPYLAKGTRVRIQRGIVTTTPARQIDLSNQGKPEGH
jgi:hypothetical protein